MIETNIIIFISSYFFYETIFLLNKNDFNMIYFALHFIINLFNTICILPFLYNFIEDPLFLESYNNYSWLIYLYPALISLHNFHMIHNLKQINLDEIVHHILTYSFWGLILYLHHPIYIASLIIMSGIPGGITYGLLFLKKLNLIKSITEKKVSKILNVWVRSPGCVMFGFLYIIRTLILKESNMTFYMNIFMALWTMINGIHFMDNICESYYTMIANPPLSKKID